MAHGLQSSVFQQHKCPDIVNYCLATMPRYPNHPVSRPDLISPSTQ